MKAIETEYNGTLFRSRLEAKWALFFDHIGIEYMYEPEGYLYPDGTKYLPDFYLPQYKIFVEVKGPLSNFKDDLEKKVGRFFENINIEIYGCLILTDIPMPKAVNGSSVYWFPYIYFDMLKQQTRITLVPIVEKTGTSFKNIIFTSPISEWLSVPLRKALKNIVYSDILPVPDTNVLLGHSMYTYPLKYSDFGTNSLDAAYTASRRYRFEPGTTSVE